LSETTIRCLDCGGTGKVTVQTATTALSSSQPHYESRSCGTCGGSGTGARAGSAELHRYYAERSSAPEDLFALAKSVAAATRQPRARATRTETVQVSSGFLGRKTRSEKVTRESEMDYWVLATKKGWTKRIGSCRERGSSVEEEDNYETIFCLTTSGAFSKFKRTQQTVLWDNHRFEDLGWSGYSAQQLKSLDQFLADFDFEGSIRHDSPGCFTEYTTVVGDMDFFLERGNEPFMRQTHPKGMGLYNALIRLRG